MDILLLGSIGLWALITAPTVINILTYRKNGEVHLMTRVFRAEKARQKIYMGVLVSIIAAFAIVKQCNHLMTHRGRRQNNLGLTKTDAEKPALRQLFNWR